MGMRTRQITHTRVGDETNDEMVFTSCSQMGLERNPERYPGGVVGQACMLASVVYFLSFGDEIEMKL